MGAKIFQLLEKHMSAETAGVFVEIGSDRYEGSTAFLANLAQQHGTKLISVDILPEAKNRLKHQFDNIEFVIQNGSEWAREFAHSATDVALVYLDNFDYIYDVKDIQSQDIVRQQVADYAARGTVMNNVNCQVEHMKQLLALKNLFHKDTVIMFDDTYRLNDCWVGKCGPCVTYLLCHGYEILEWTTDCGMIMKRKS